MPFKGLKIKDPVNGLPRQAVPYRLMPLILGISPDEAISLMVDDDGMGVLLKGYEHAGGHKKRLVTHHQAEQILANLKGKPFKEKIAAIPAKNFSWSDELIDAFEEKLSNNLDRETVIQLTKNITWNPALEDCDELIHETPDLSHLGDLIKSEYSVALEERNTKIKAKAQELLDGRMNPRNVASTIANLGEFLDLRNDNSLTSKQIHRILDKP